MITLNGTTGITTPDVTTDDLTVDTNTLYVDATNNRVGIGTSSPTQLLSLYANDTTDTQLIIEQDSTGDAGIQFSLTGVKNWTVGVDNSDSDKFKIENGNAIGSSNDFVIDSSGNVGIGTSSPGTKLHVNGLIRTAEGTAAAPALQVGDGDSGIFDAGINILGFTTNGSEKMRIDSSGYLLHACTTQDSNNSSGVRLHPDGAIFATRTSEYSGIFRRSSTNGGVILFRRDASNVGSISVTTSATAYNTSSDYRLKENVAPMSGSIDRLKQLKPSTWSWVQDGSHGEGFLAHEAQEVVPEAVSGTKDAMKTEEYEVTPAVLDDDGNVVTEAVMGTREVPDYQGIDQSKLVPLLTAALQEAITKIESLEARVATLEGN